MDTFLSVQYTGQMRITFYDVGQAARQAHAHICLKNIYLQVRRLSNMYVRDIMDTYVNTQPNCSYR